MRFTRLVLIAVEEYEARNTHPRIRACPELAVALSLVEGAAEWAFTDLWAEGPAPSLHPAPVPNVSEGPAHGACFIADICTEKMLQ